VNNLAPAPVDDAETAEDAASERYLLPRHAHIVVYERDASTDRADGPGERGADASASGSGDGGDASAGGEADAAGASQLVTIYDCGAAQKPPSAQLLGQLGSVRAACETTRNPTGYVVSMREPSMLVAEGDGQYVVRPR
jgi:hypothetical protein